MSMISPISCLMGRHSPIRRNVKWDGRKYIGHCKHCGKAIERISHRNWREQVAKEHEETAL